MPPFTFETVLHIPATPALCALERETPHASLHGAAQRVGVLGGFFVFSSDVVFRLFMFVFDRAYMRFHIGFVQRRNTPLSDTPKRLYRINAIC